MPNLAKRLQSMTKPRPPVVVVAFTALQEMRAEALKQADYFRLVVFNDWVERCVEHADEPREWTQARVLYENYLAHTRSFGEKEEARRVSVQEQATETHWGRMMSSVFPKRRRGSGWHYPLKLRARRGPL